jgi:prevent-host-death family protein
MTSTVSSLKAHLSENLRRVAEGETVIVTDRRKPIARIVPYEDEDLVEFRPTVPFAFSVDKLVGFPAVNALKLLNELRGTW